MTGAMEEFIRLKRDAAMPHPSHICLECGALVSSEHDWPAVHARWHALLKQSEGTSYAGT